MYSVTNTSNAIVDIDLTDPDVEAAASKIQAAFKMRGKKNLFKK